MKDKRRIKHKVGLCRICNTKRWIVFKKDGKNISVRCYKFNHKLITYDGFLRTIVGMRIIK